MKGSKENKCERCSATVPGKSTETLCPACLLSGAIAPPNGATATITVAPAGPLELHGPSKFPCDFGGYRLLSLLGRGGMGIVYEAEEVATGRRLALKILGLQLDSPDMRERFLREGRLAARVNHPNSLYVFGSDEVNGLPVITMEIAASGTLKDQLKLRGPLPVADAVDAILDVVSGLESALDHGILHRDIKPSNCFVCPDGSVKVGDFGLSVSTLSKTDTFATMHGKIMGTPAYASPEQLRGDSLDVRADIYSVGATLFTLLTNRAPFEGENAVQVVANAVNEKPALLSGTREHLPPGLERVIMRCLAKSPEKRYADYSAFRNALLPFSSKEPEPASILTRVSAGWIDYLIAFLPPYVALMLLVGAENLLIKPIVEGTLYAARYYLVLFGFGFLYFGIAEGIWGAGLGKWLKGLRVIRSDGHRPGIGPALLRILLPVLCVEGIRIPLMMALMPSGDWSGMDTAIFVAAAIICGWLPVFPMLRANRANRYATFWDKASGTNVVIKPQGVLRPCSMSPEEPLLPTKAKGEVGPYQITEEMIPGQWLAGFDPLLRRSVWLRQRQASGISTIRRDIARPGRLRWLQAVETGKAVWDAYEATPGKPFTAHIERGRKIPWSTMRHWLHDLASELWSAAGDETLPAKLSIGHVWITNDGRAVLLDETWPTATDCSEPITSEDVKEQQRFLARIAESVDHTTVPLHARGILENLKAKKFERLSFLAGTLSSLVAKPTEVGRSMRAASVFMIPSYIWIALLVGRYHDKPWSDPLSILTASAFAVLALLAIIQLLALPFRSTISHSIFRLAIIDDNGRPATAKRMLLRWTVVWIPLFISLLCTLPVTGLDSFNASPWGTIVLLLWLGAAVHTAFHPHRGWHDRLAGTWVVRR